MNDKITEIVRKAQAGDRHAFEQLYTAYDKKLRSYIRSNLSDKSQEDDVMQNVFISVYNKIGQLKDADSFNSWIHTIARNECMTVNGRTSKERERFTPMTAYGNDGGEEDEYNAEFEDTELELPEEYATNKEIQKLLLDELNSLPQKQRNCLVLYYYDAMRFQLKNLNKLEWYDHDNIKQLEKWGFEIIKANYRSEKYIQDFTKLINENIDKCSHLFEDWINWDYMPFT